MLMGSSVQPTTKMKDVMNRTCTSQLANQLLQDILHIIYVRNHLLIQVYHLLMQVYFSLFIFRFIAEGGYFNYQHVCCYAFRAYVAEVHATLWAVRGKRSDPRVPRHHLEERNEGLVKLRELVGGALVKVRHADD